MVRPIYSKDSQKDLKKIPNNFVKKIIKKIKLLALNPLLGKRLSGDYEGYYSLRAWPYRVIYKFDKGSKKVLILRIAHCQGAYD